MNVKVEEAQALCHTNISSFPREISEQKEVADFKLYENWFGLRTRMTLGLVIYSSH